MIKTGNEDINFRSYWNKVYENESSRATYASQGTDTNTLEVAKNTHVCSVKTQRFTTALKYIKSGQKVCDIGCGVGVFTDLVKKTYPKCEVWGTDISDTAIESNKKNNPDIKYQQGYIGDLNFLPDEYFDVVFCGETIEHLQDPIVLFNEAKRILKKTGKLIITTPKDDHIKSDEHLWYFNQNDVENLFLEAKYNNIKFEYLPDTEHLFIIFAVGEK